MALAFRDKIISIGWWDAGPYKNQDRWQQEAVPVSTLRKESDMLALHISQADLHPNVTLFAKTGERSCNCSSLCFSTPGGCQFFHTHAWSQARGSCCSTSNWTQWKLKTSFCQFVKINSVWCKKVSLNSWFLEAASALFRNSSSWNRTLPASAGKQLTSCLTGRFAQRSLWRWDVERRGALAQKKKS